MVRDNYQITKLPDFEETVRHLDLGLNSWRKAAPIWQLRSKYVSKGRLLVPVSFGSQTATAVISLSKLAGDLEKGEILYDFFCVFFFQICISSVKF